MNTTSDVAQGLRVAGHQRRGDRGGAARQHAGGLLDREEVGDAGSRRTPLIEDPRVDERLGVEGELERFVGDQIEDEVLGGRGDVRAEFAGVPVRLAAGEP